MVSFQKKTKLGMSTKSSKLFLITINLLKLKHVGGCVGMIFIPISINSTSRKFSLQLGNNIPSLMNGLETLLEDLTLGPRRSLKIRKMIRMISGSTTPSFDFLFQRKLKFTSA